MIELDEATLRLPNPDSVRVATRRDIAALSDVLARSFHEDPVYEWIIPDPEERARKSPAMFRLFIKQVLRHGIVLPNAPGTIVNSASGQ